MTRQGERQVFATNSSTIIANTNQASATSLDINLDPGTARIKTVFDGLFDNRSRALDNLAGGNLVSQTRLQNTNHPHPSGITKV